MIAGKSDPKAPVWKMTPMIDVPGQYGLTRYEFIWEREWRHVGTFSFKPDDVAFLLIPEELHGNAIKFFKTAYQDHLGPAYFCPIVGPLWSRAKILAALQNHQPNHGTP